MKTKTATTLQGFHFRSNWLID